MKTTRGDRSTPDSLRSADWLVGDCDMLKARRLIAEYHYAVGTSNTATGCHGLFRRADMAMVGAAWWIPPTRSAAAARWDEPEEVLSLSRLALVPGTPKNAATFLLMRSVRLIGPAWRCLLTYADTWRGHTGHIYRAAGWEYLGLTKPERVYVKDGRMVARKAGPRTRTHAEMLAIGAECVGSFPRHAFRLVRNLPVRRRPTPVRQSMLFADDNH